MPSQGIGVDGNRRLKHTLQSSESRQAIVDGGNSTVDDVHSMGVLNAFVLETSSLLLQLADFLEDFCHCITMGLIFLWKIRLAGTIYDDSGRQRGSKQGSSTTKLIDPCPVSRVPCCFGFWMPPGCSKGTSPELRCRP